MLDWIRALPLRADKSPADTIDEDAELIARAKVDREAFEPLYVQYLEPVYRYCYRKLGDREAAEDATSQVFFKALSALPGYHAGSFRGWLFTIAHNVVVDTVRQQKPGRPLEEAYFVKDDDPTPEDNALAIEQHRTLVKHLAKLPEDQRSVMQLRLAGLTGDEIAQTLKRSNGSVKMLQFRAVTRLRVLMAADVNVEKGLEEARYGK